MTRWVFLMTGAGWLTTTFKENRRSLAAYALWTAIRRGRAMTFVTF